MRPIRGDASFSGGCAPIRSRPRGTPFGPRRCVVCGWSEDEDYDLSEGRNPVDERGGVIDQFGGYHPPGSSMALAYRLAEDFDKGGT